MAPKTTTKDKEKEKVSSKSGSRRERERDRDRATPAPYEHPDASHAKKKYVSLTQPPVSAAADSRP
ncbi:hypothetical protein THARTR1_01023 [Trichoderma harzianum]|uniref:Uncharacterized protein n=1 Tax=Trichoderma harzianum TaxID=5544 RepID=A0A2K0UNB1_TRIHA|nr:hypothetical protein THARTR1_01023 [Trichoderma harzianum]